MEKAETMKIAVRCKKCSHLIAYKVSAASGFLEVKCPRCGEVSKINLALRNAKPLIFYRMAKPPEWAQSQS